LRIHVFGVHEEEGGQEKGIGAAIGEPHICLEMEVNGLVEPTLVAVTKLVRRLAWQAPTELVMWLTREVVASIFALPR
jgi:hypothetical protein